MAILNNNPLVGASGNQGGYNINNSLRFRASASAYLSRTPASAGNRKTWTYSGWIKRSTLNTFQCLLGAGSSGSARTFILFNAGAASTNDNILLFHYNGATGYGAYTTPVYRDPSAWYHIVVAVDTTQATSTNRIKIYVNGVQQTASGFDGGYPAQNTDFFINNNTLHTISKGSDGSNDFIDGYQTETYFIDGSQLTPSDFGETDTTTGVWKPKAYSGTYGTNGFYLKFSDIATTSGSNAGLGKDFSGNGNYWTTNNISVTSGTTYDAMTDSPTLTSATVANYCVLNPLFKDSSVSVSDANMYFTTSANSIRTYSTIGIPTTGKYYWEVTATTALNIIVGIGTGVLGAGNNLGSSTGDIAYNSNANTGSIVRENSNLQTGLGSASNNDIIAVALNMDAGTIAFYRNNTQLGSNQSIPTTTNTFFPAFGTFFSGANGHVNFGQRPFSYTPPTGFKALNTYNLEDSTVVKGNKYMDATLYTGTGSSLNVTGVNFQPDFVWIKERVGAADHGLYDAVRGVQKQLESNTTTAETTETTGLTAFNSNGFTVGALAQLNTNTDTYVGWSWKANGAGSSNTSGSITSTVSVNTTAGFSIVTYTGNGTAGATVGHGLGVAPKMIIVKWRSSAGGSWATWHSSFVTASNTDYLLLDSTISKGGAGSLLLWNNTAPTSSVFSIGTNIGVNTNTGTYVAYCWAEIAGFSKFGSYTGNGSTDGPFVYTGFRPKFILIKCSSNGGTGYAWFMYDTARNTFNTISDTLQANVSDATYTDTVISIDVLSNGFKVRGTAIGTNQNGGTMIYAAFAENPFKNSLAR